MKRIVYLFILVLTAHWTFAQQDTVNMAPQSQIKVNKEYDEDGNLVRFDSSSVSTWSFDSTYVEMDMDSLHDQMKLLFGDGFDSFFNDTTLFDHGSFEDLHKKFFEQHQKFLNQFGMITADSLMHAMPGIKHDFSDFDRIRKEMEEQFKQFYQRDSTNVEFKGVQ